MDLQTQLQELKTSTQAKLAEMRGEHSKELQELRVAVLGKKGSLTDLLKGSKTFLMKNALKLVKWSTKFVTF